MPGSTTITASPSRIRVTVPATRPSSPSRPTYPSCSTNTDADPPGAIVTSATGPTLPARDQAGQRAGAQVIESSSPGKKCAKGVFRARRGVGGWCGRRDGCAEEQGPGGAGRCGTEEQGREPGGVRGGAGAGRCGTEELGVTGGGRGG